MKSILYMLLYFVIFNLIVTIPFYFFDLFIIAKTSFYSLVFLSTVWALIRGIFYLGLKRKIDRVNLSLVINIGLKFILSLFFVSFCYYLNFFSSIQSISLFIVYYFIYSFLIHHHNKKILI